jgi:sec-independent protein translocase protein TatA
MSPLVDPPLALFGSLGPAEIVVILVVFLLIFGAKRLPELARSMGTSINEFKRGLKEEASPTPTQTLPEGKAAPDDEEKKES